MIFEKYYFRDCIWQVRYCSYINYIIIYYTYNISLPAKSSIYEYDIILLGVLIL